MFCGQVKLVNISDITGVIAGKLTAIAIRLSGAGLGSSLPGRVARILSPTVLHDLSAQAVYGTVAITGTNGKSTTSGILSSILRVAGLEIIHNRQGANLVGGITASLIESSSWSAKINSDYCLFEIDEAALPVVAKEVKIGSVVVTNLFRDQLDRFGELDTTAKLIGKGISINNSKAILNADDPNVSQLVPDNPKSFFGIESLANDSAISPEARHDTAAGNVQIHAELSYCQSCGGEINYSRIYYGQLGIWSCSSCQFNRSKPTVFASQVAVTALNSDFQLHIGERSEHVHLPLPGLYNVYNALAAAAAANALGIAIESIKAGIKTYSTLFGRSERLTIRGKHVLIQLIKNPAGASQSLSAVALDKNARVLIAINDNLADGRDISWLWDADFEQLANLPRAITVSGQRGEDMAVRMKYAGVSSNQITCIPQLDQALKYSLNNTQSDETLWVLPTYTCLLELQKILKKLGHKLAGT